MPKRDWCFYSAVIGGVIALLLGLDILNWAAISHLPSRPSGGSPQAERHSDQSKAKHDAPAVKAQKAQAYDPGCPYPKNREDADLCEQRRMAKAAEDAAAVAESQFWWNVAQAFATVFAAFATAFAALAAGAAARSANRTVKVMERAAETDLRAYVSLGNPRLVDVGPDKKPTAEFIMVNSGRTPAQNVRLALAYYLGKEFKTAAAPNPLVLDGASKAFIGSNQRVPSRVGLDGLLSENQFQAIKENRAQVFVYGTITYDDPFRAGRTTGFRLAYNSKNIARQDPVLHVCDDGNHAD